MASPFAHLFGEHFPKHIFETFLFQQDMHWQPGERR